jgi:membrane protease YdiL (CAAX protease family)
MNTNPTLVQRYALPLYLILTPLISLAIALLLPLPTVLIVLLVLLAPSTLAILLAGLAEGRRGVSDLLKKLFQWNVSLKWYAITLALPVGIIFASGVLAFLFGWSSSVQVRLPALSQLITNLILVIFIAILEELGWRGFALCPDCWPIALPSLPH